MRNFRLAVAVLSLAAGSLPAQPTAGRDAYRTAFRAWREAQPSLETDAATAGDALAERAVQSATAAAAFGAARADFLRQWADDQGQNVLWLQNAVPLALTDFAPAADLQRLVDAETTIVNTNISNFAGDTDRGILQLRQALETERGALAALGVAIGDRQNAHEKAAHAAEVLESAVSTALGEYQSVTGVLSQSAALVDKETAAWATYHTALAEAARGIARAPTAPVVSGAAAPPPRPPSVTSLPLTRYTGMWVYPTVNTMFHGAEPESVDLSVHEENGKATGSFYARFKLPPGSTVDPQLRFDFSGDFHAPPRQTFDLVTSDGAKGTVEFIPGAAFNLLEINFQVTDPVPGKINAADLLLVKK